MDDEETTRILIKAILKKKNFEVITASSGKDALSLVKEQKYEFDVILLDVMMPELNGFEVLELLKGDPHAKNIKVIMLTAMTQVGSKVRAFSAGASDYIIKPFEKDELISRVDMQVGIKRANEALKESENRYSTIVKRGNIGVVIIKNLKIIFINQKVVNMAGYTADEVLNLDFAKVVTMESLKVALPRMVKRLKGESVTSTYEIELIHKDGRIIPAEISNAKIDYHGGPADLVLIRDITERKQAEEEIKQKNEELRVIGEELHEVNLHLEQKVDERTAEVEELLKHKDEFISQLGHDIKTPLTPLTSLLPIVGKKQTDPKSKELLEICIRNVSYIKNLVVSTLQLARVTSEDTIFDKKEINLFDITSCVLSDNQTTIKDNEIEIENRIDEKTIVLADDLRLREVLSNLIINAIKFMENGGTLTLFSEENDDGFVTVSIKDTGIGLNDEAKSNLFKEFYKADKSRHELDSSGLGLAICKRIVEKHGGTIWAKSPGVGKGTTFYFTIPKKQIEALAVLAG